jgi:hypothetical protein
MTRTGASTAGSVVRTHPWALNMFADALVMVANYALLVAHYDRHAEYARAIKVLHAYQQFVMQFETHSRYVLHDFYHTQYNLSMEVVDATR